MAYLFKFYSSLFLSDSPNENFLFLKIPLLVSVRRCSSKIYLDQLQLIRQTRMIGKIIEFIGEIEIKEIDLHFLNKFFYISFPEWKVKGLVEIEREAML